MARLHVPTVFQLLNRPAGLLPWGGGEFSVEGTGKDSTIEKEVQAAMKIVQKSEPSGVTHMARRLNEIKKEIEELQRTANVGRRVVVTVATDGIPTDDNGNVGGKVDAELERSLEYLYNALPVSIIIRLCTGDDRVVEYYNQLDASSN
jgi:hypothetical protein